MKETVLSIIVAGALIGGVVVMSGKNQENGAEVPINNVSIVAGTQIIEITAKGGYQPRKSSAQAGMPTILRINTNGTFDCSSSVRIPSMDISKNLPQTGVTDIDLGKLSVGVLSATCCMGMYPFEIEVRG